MVEVVRSVVAKLASVVARMYVTLHHAAVVAVATMTMRQS